MSRILTLTHPHSAQRIEVAENHAAKYLGQGWREATPDAPKGNAPLADWQEFARSQGFTDEQLEGMKRDDIRAALS